MNWICLYCAQLNGEVWFFYGYATRAEGLTASAHWRRQESTTLAGGVQLIEFQLAGDDRAVDELRENFGQASTILALADNQTVTLRHGGLVFRPEVFSMPLTLDPFGVPVSLSDQLSRIGAHWQLNPERLLNAVAAHPTLPANEREECLSRILSWINDATGIDFVGWDAGRLGNFEDVRYVCGSYDQPDGLRHRPEPATENRGASVLVWVEPPLAGRSPLLIGCRLFNGHPRERRTLLLNVVTRWDGPRTPPLRFTAAEPISSYEICVWGEANGSLVSQQDEWVLRSIDADMAITDRARFVSTAWDQNLPAHLRQRVVAETAVTVVPLTIGDYRADPWVAAEDGKRTLLHQLGPESGSGRFFPAGDAYHVEAMLFLARLMNRRGVQRVVIADPYLDESAVAALLVRIRDVPEVVLLSSHDQALPNEVHDDQETWWKGSVKGTACHWLGVAADWCRKEQVAPERREPTSALVAACKEQVAALPNKVTVVNVRSADGNGNQFHDRNIVVELKGGAREVWSLTNSLSMVARRYPLLITLTEPSVGRLVADHLAQLQSGNVPGKPNLRSDLLWENPTPAVLRQPRPLAADRPSRFQLAHIVLGLLAADVDPSDQLTEALNRGLLEEETGPERTSWRVPQPARGEVVAYAIAAIQSAGDNAGEVLRAVGEWEYFGGLPESAYGFDASIVPLAETALRAILNSATGRDIPSPLNLSRPARFPECFDDVRHYVNANAPGDMEPRGLPGLSFMAEILWRLAPERLVAVAAETGGSTIPAWLATNIGRATPTQAQALLHPGQPRMIALGITLLWDRVWPDATPLPEKIAVLEAEMTSAGIEPIDRYLVELALCAPGNRSRAELQQALSTGLGPAPADFDEASRDRLIKILSPPGPLHRIARVSVLACLTQVPAMAASLHTWVVTQTLQNLHFRGAPVPVWDSGSLAWDDLEVHAAFAESYWRAHGPQASQRFVTEVLRRLNLRAVDAPLFPTRDYDSWSDQVTALLWGLQLGVSVVNSASPADRAATLARIRMELIRCLAQFRPSLWHIYGDFHGLLASLVTTISAWVDDPAADVDRTAWESLLLRSEVPELWKVYATLGSSRLTEGRIGDLASWAQDSASSMSLCGAHRVTHTRRAMLAALDNRKTSLPVLAQQLDAIEASFVAWWDARYLIA